MVSWIDPTATAGATISGYTITPYAGTTARHAGVGERRDGDVGRVTGLTERHGLHLHSVSDQQHRRARRRQRLGGGHPARTRSSTSRAPRRPSTPAIPLGRARGEVHGVGGGVGDRDPLLQGHDQHRHARRHAVDRDGDAAGLGHVHQRDRRRAGRRCCSPARSRSPPDTITSRLPRAQRPLLVHAAAAWPPASSTAR